jgi:hypothetical protein
MPIPTRARTSALGGYVTGHGDEESGFTSPVEERDNGEAEGDCEGVPVGQGAKVQTSSGHPAATVQGRRGGGRQQGRLEPCRPRRAIG